MAAEGHLNQVAAAAELGLTTRQIQRLEKHGIPRNPDGTYRFPETKKWYAEFKKAEGRRRARGSDTADYEKARAERMAAAARKLQLEVAILEGDLIPAETYRRRLHAAAFRISGKLDSIPGGWAARLAACQSIHDVQLVLRTLVRELKEELAREADQIEAEVDELDGDDATT